MLVDNLQEEALILQRLVYVAIKEVCGMKKINITMKIIHSVRNGRQLQKDALIKRNTEWENNNQQMKKSKYLEYELADLRCKKLKLISDTFSRHQG